MSSLQPNSATRIIPEPVTPRLLESSTHRLKFGSPNLSPPKPGKPDFEEAYLITEDDDLMTSAPKIQHRVTLSFKNLSYSVQIKERMMTAKGYKHVNKEILKGLTGVCRPGELTAIMGASGAGKTTLLNILSLRVLGNSKNKLTGQFLANGNAYDPTQFSKFAGYVMQNDVLFETMTPREILQFSADMRISGNKKLRTKKVEGILTELQLLRAADTLVGGYILKGISGGERKRTSIAVELISDPEVLFLDEPTSGLDSFTTFLLINLLKRLALQGKSIIFTIHQPSSETFFLFDNLMVLAKGKFIYQGPAITAVDYFGRIGYKCPEYTNPADYFIEIVHSDGQDDTKFHAMYKAFDQQLAPAIEEEANKPSQKQLTFTDRRIDFLPSLILIAKRSLLNYLRSPMLLRARCVQTIFVSLLIGYIFFKLSHDPNDPQASMNINGCCFFLSLAILMICEMEVVLSFPSERAVFLREYSSDMYTVSAYYFEKSAVGIPFTLFFTTVMICIIYFTIGFSRTAEAFFVFWFTLCMMAIMGDAAGLMIGCLFNDAKVASVVVPALVLPWMVFGGVFVNLSTLPKWIGWLQYISPVIFSLEALMRNEYVHSAFGLTPVHEYGFEVGLWGSIGALIGIGLICRCLALFFLKKLVKKME